APQGASRHEPATPELERPPCAAGDHLRDHSAALDPPMPAGTDAMEVILVSPQRAAVIQGFKCARISPRGPRLAHRARSFENGGSRCSEIAILSSQRRGRF